MAALMHNTTQVLKNKLNSFLYDKQMHSFWNFLERKTNFKREQIALGILYWFSFHIVDYFVCLRYFGLSCFLFGILLGEWFSLQSDWICVSSVCFVSLRFLYGFYKWFSLSATMIRSKWIASSSYLLYFMFEFDLFLFLLRILTTELRASNSKAKWLVYWLIYTSFILAEYWRYAFKHSLPLYWLGKCIFLIWLMMSEQTSGIYQQIIRRFILPPWTVRLKHDLKMFYCHS
jgi:hypothetical protein